MRELCCVAGAAVALSIATGAEAGADDEGWWLAPLDRLTLRLSAADEHDRPYSVPVRPRQIAGGIALSCDYQEGRPCGDGVGTALELDSARAQLDFGDRVQLGGSRMLMLGGEGAPDYGGFTDFILEHFGRTHETPTGTAENNRLSFDLSVRLPELRGARLYYEIAFED